MTGPMAAERLGITYRQLDWWYRRGYLGNDSSNRGPGSGNERQVTLAEFERASALAALVKVGISISAAVKHLDHATTQPDGSLTIDADGMRLTITRSAA